MRVVRATERVLCQVRTIPKGKSFSTQVTEQEEFAVHLKAKKPVVVDFFATWCGPCKHISPVYEALESKHPELTFLKVNVDDAGDIVSKYGVQSMPTFLFFNGKDPEPIDTLIGAGEQQLKDKVAGLKKLVADNA